MSRAKVQINEMRLRVPGLARKQAQHLGELVAERLARHTLAGDQRSRMIPSLNIRLHSNAGSSVEQMASEIAGRIGRSIG
ncbi:MAG: hypothetical protein DMF74_12660 [Acidobacteria bacterium]|nr:MAG: hypothetical protein DMF74_12660 [Acidobacteriota bacterium]